MRGEEWFAALIFGLGGFVAYIIYEFVRFLRPAHKFRLFLHIADGIFAVFAAVFFVVISHFLFGGRIKYFTLLCFLCGGLLARATTRTAIRKLAFFIHRLYKSNQATNTNDTIKEVKMANAKTNQSNMNQQNKQQNKQQSNQQNKQQNKQQSNQQNKQQNNQGTQKAKSTRTTKG